MLFKSERLRIRAARSLVTILVFTLISIIQPLNQASALSVGSKSTQKPSSEKNLTATNGKCSSDVGDNSSSAVEIIEGTNYCVIKFKAGTNTWTTPAGVTQVRLLIVGGGGAGGGGRGGGGGAGGFYEVSNYAVAAQTYSITVGAGGAGSTSTGGDGGSSVFGSITINGGGGGGVWAANGASKTGASSGGAGSNYSGANPVGGTTTPQSISTISVRGSSGGQCDAASGSACSDMYRNTGGGGGAGGVGKNGSGGNNQGTSGNAPDGGAGVTSDITGTSTWYAGGGGGATSLHYGEWNSASYRSATKGAGGSGIGGTGGYLTSSTTGIEATAGAANTGSGGGGGADGGVGIGALAGGAGGSGVVIIKYLPMIYWATYPQPITVTPGETATFSATPYTPFAGSTRTFKWQYLPVGGTWTDVSTGTGYATTTYTTPVLTRSMTGYQYRVAATDTYDGAILTSYTDGARLIVMPAGGETDTALNITGSTTYAAVSNGSNIFGQRMTTYSLEAWVKPSATCDGSTYCTVMTQSLGFLLDVYQGKITYFIGSGAAWCDSGGANIVQNAVVPSGKWSHIALVRNSENVKIYLNGSLVSDKNSSCTPSYHDLSSNTFEVGGRACCTDQAFIGIVDEVRMWNTDRGSSIASDMNSNETSTSGLLNYWNFNEGTGTTAYNQAAGASDLNDLTLKSATAWDSIGISDVTTTAPYTTRTFYRTYLTKFGGWKVPSGVKQLSTLIVGGGGGGSGGYTTQTNNLGGGGGGGGVYQLSVYSVTPSTYVTTIVGAGGAGGKAGSTNSALSGADGGSSQFANIVAGGGGGGGAKSGTVAPNGLNGLAGGAGGGASYFYGYNIHGSGGVGSNLTIAGKTFTGTTGGVGADAAGANGGGGGGANGNGSGTTGGAGLASSFITGSSVTYGAGGSSLVSPAQKSAYGAGGDGTSSSTNGTNGVNGLISIRYLTATKPAFTYPTNAYLNVGMTETFTTNVATDSATVGLTRTFRWESTTPTSSGVYSLIKQGSGVGNAVFSWVPSDTSTSGPTYLYRVIVTDTDTEGFSIQDTSTSVYAVINPALVVTGNSNSRTLAKTINIAKNETFTINFGTPTYRSVLTPVISGFTLDTTTASSPILKIGETVTVGTYYETLTVTDSVSASVAIPLTIKVTAPPNLLNTGEIVSDGLVLNFEAGNSQSILSMSDTTTGYVWKDLSGRKNNAATDKNAASGYNGVACTAPTYSNDFGGIVKFKSGSTNCFYTDYSGSELEKSYTVEAWFRLDSTLPNWAAVVAQSFTSDPQPISIAIGSMGDSKMYVGYYDGSGAGGWRYCATAHTPTIGKWTHIAGTYGVIGGANRALTTYVDGQQICTVDWNGDFGSRVNTSGILIGKGHSGGTATFPGAIAAVRIYKVPLTSAQILQNFNATKSRFDTVNQTQIKPAQKYGVKSVESFTVTSGGDTKTVAIASGSRVGLAWDTATVANQVSFTLGDSLTVGTYSDTITVTDNLGASTFVPMTFTITQADTLTVYYETPTALSYTGNKAIINPPLRVTGLSGLESGTATATLKFKPAGTSCATGGTCVVGDIGPGGGIVFIVPSGSNTKYYEAAPANWTGTDDLASVAKYCSNTNSNALATTNWGIGWGETNTTVAKTLCGTNDAIAILNSFNASNNTGYSNWFIPAGDELAALATVRDQAGLLRLGSNWTTGTYGYWTSTEYTNTQKSLVTGDGSWVIGATDKTDTTHNMIRPVRSFTPCWAVDTCTAFLTTDTPTAAGRYALVPSNLAVGAGSLSNYVAVTYATTSVTINKINQTPQQIPWYNLTYPATMTINLGGGSGSGAIKYSVTDGFTNPGCSLDYKKLSTSKLGVCNLTVVKAADRNYNTDTATAVIWFVQIENNQPTNQVGSGTTIALNGINTLTIADTVTVQAPSITSITITSGPIGTLISIKGSGFSGATVKFYRNVAAVITSNDGSEIRVTVPSGARTGPIIVSTPNGQAASSVFTVL